MTSWVTRLGSGSLSPFRPILACIPDSFADSLCVCMFQNTTDERRKVNWYGYMTYMKVCRLRWQFPNANCHLPDLSEDIWTKTHVNKTSKTWWTHRTSTTPIIGLYYQVLVLGVQVLRCRESTVVIFMSNVHALHICKAHRAQTDAYTVHTCQNVWIPNKSYNGQEN